MPDMVRFLALPLVFVAGLFALLFGSADQHAANRTYIAYFGSAGDECEARVHFDKATGQVLDCAGSDFTVKRPGFTKAQNAEIEALAKELGADSFMLDESDQVRIQQRIDDIAATLPESVRRDGALSLGPLWGADLAWTGVAAIVLSLLGMVMPSRRR